MNARKRWMYGGLALAAALAAAAGLSRPRASAPATVPVAEGPLQVWSVYDGYLESRDEKNIMSLLHGAATVAELAPDGARVQAGDVIVRFDASQWERDRIRIERDYALAQEELRTLESAKLPLEISDLELKLAEATRQCSNEVQTLSDSRDLLADGLISEQEVKQQEVRAEAARQQMEAAARQLDLTRTLLHPSALERATINLASVEEELNLARRQMSNCVIRATSDGRVAYKALGVSGEFRTIRAGDTVWRNQPFLTLSNMSNLLTRCDVPESDLSRVAVGCEATVRPVAYPDLSLHGTVESVGSMAQTSSSSGKNTIQRFFNVVIRLTEVDPACGRACPCRRGCCPIRRRKPS